MEYAAIPAIIGGLVVAIAAWRLAGRQWWRASLAVVLGLLAGLLVFGGAYDYWYYHRPLPEPVEQQLFQGIHYRREIRSEPRPLVIHLVTIDLDAPGIDFLVTPENSYRGRHLRARTVSGFVDAYDVQLAVNASPFSPWHANGPLDYYPHSGDPVDPAGLTISRGNLYSSSEAKWATLYIARDNRVSIGEPIEDAWNAVSGFRVILRDGRVVDTHRRTPPVWAPRTAAGLDRSGRRMLLIVVDGRQPNYSEGVTQLELARIGRELGAYTLLNLDGGGSSTLAIEGPDGKAVVLNSPVHGRVPPGRERPVAAHLGVFAQHLERRKAKAPQE